MYKSPIEIKLNDWVKIFKTYDLSKAEQIQISWER